MVKKVLYLRLKKAISKFGNDNIFVLTARPQKAVIKEKITRLTIIKYTFI